MKNTELSVATILGFMALINADASISVVKDPRTGIEYAVKAVNEYVSGFLTAAAGENGEILNPANKPAPGLRTIAGNQLTTGRYQVVHAIRFLFDDTAATETEASLKSRLFETDAPAAFRNGEVRINQGAELTRLTGSDCSNFRASTSNNDDFREIVPVVLRPNVDTSINLKLAGVPAAGVAYKYEHRAVEFVQLGHA